MTNHFVTFLNPQQATQHIQQHHQDYIHTTLQCSSNAKHRSYSSVHTFCQHIKPWTTHQQHEITKIINHLQQSCWSWKALLCDDPWRFIHVNDKLEDGMPHTIHSAIVLPSWLVNTLCSRNTKQADYQRAIETLVHERIHVLQKLHRTRFDLLYQAWGFQRVDNVSLSLQDTVRQIHMHHATRTNPDTPQQWLLHNRWYLFVHLPRGASSMREVGYYLIDVKNNEKEWQPLRRVKSYNDYYGNESHCYHPDESCAVLLAKMVVQDYDTLDTLHDKNMYVDTCDACVVMQKWLNEL